MLGKSLSEGSADFIGELISGNTDNPHLHEYGNPREKQLWLEFKKEMNGTYASNWLYQGDRAKDKPADLGYYVGYFIAESYYSKAQDKNRQSKTFSKSKISTTFSKRAATMKSFQSNENNCDVSTVRRTINGCGRRGDWLRPITRLNSEEIIL